MLAIRRFKGCPRCGGDLVEEPGTERLDRHIRYISCLLCGELTYAETPVVFKVEETRGKPGRPRKVAAG